MKSITGLAVTAVCLVVVSALGLLVGLGIGYELGFIQEDSSLWNCKFMGDWNCGPNTPWHGFVNVFTAPE